MIAIYLCDDNRFWLRLMEKKIEKRIADKNYDMQIVYAAENPRELLSHLLFHPPLNGVYFLDIDFNVPMDGIELARKIRELDPRGFIIFVTVHINMAVKTFQYKVEAMDYILKDGMVESRSSIGKHINGCLKQVVDLHQRSARAVTGTIAVRSCGSDYVIQIEDIIYIETIRDSRKIRINLLDESYETAGWSIAKFQEKLGDSFYRCNEGFIINVNKIKEMHLAKREVVMENGVRCHASISKFPPLKKIVQTLATRQIGSGIE